MCAVLALDASVQFHQGETEQTENVCTAASNSLSLDHTRQRDVEMVRFVTRDTAFCHKLFGLRCW